ncbi:6-bladed beta-propeller [Echinicola salinicaeni]|uniref:6-bladed beta-propeller n=1 Tax=Echinicola salinicaeni TaxID=2762757 RepID=UPI001646AEB8|nr:6-bladed beta-propeller [Echinicola salinicaeni]
MMTRLQKALFKITCVLLSFFTLSCNYKDHNEDYFQVKIDLDDSRKGNLSDYFEPPEFIFLQSQDTLPLVSPYNFEFKNEKIYVLDYTLNSIFIFDKEGSFLDALLPQGKGPNEFFQPDGFQLVGENMIVQDTYLSKDLTLDNSGKVILERNNNFNNTSFYYGEDYMLYFLDYNPEFGNHNFLRKDLSSGEEETFVDIPGNLENLTKYSKRNDFVIDEMNQKLLYTIPHSTNIAVFDKETGRLDSLVYFDFGKHNMDDEFRKLDRRQKNEVIYERDYVERIDLFGVFGNTNLLYIKQGGKDHHLIFLNEQLELTDQTVNPTNDFNEIKLKFPWTLSENAIFYLKNSISFYNEYLEAYSGKEVQIREGNVHDFFSKNKEGLKDEGWILVKLRLKS